MSNGGYLNSEGDALALYAEQSGKPIRKIVPYSTEKYGPFEGWKRIMVGGVEWGTIIMRRHGSHGTCYIFRQQPGNEEIRGKDKHPVEVWSDNHVYHRWLYDGKKGPRPAPLAARLDATVSELINEKLLVSPDVIRKRNDRVRARHEAEQKRHAEAEVRKFVIKATEVLDSVWGNLDPVTKGSVLHATVEAMRWAQSQ